MESKRYQECNPLVKLIRLRHYLYVPFKWLWCKYMNPLKVIDDGTFKTDNINGVNLIELISSVCKKYILRQSDVKIPRCMLWRLLIGTAQGKMNWYYTQDEVMVFMKKKKYKKEITWNDEK